MSSKKAFTQFVQEAVQKKVNFDSSNMEDIKTIIRLAFKYYELKTYEEDETGTIIIASMIEENILSKIANLASGNHNDGIDIEYVYEGNVVRNY